MPAAATITAASEAAIAIVRLEGPRGLASPWGAPAASTSSGAAVDFGEPRLFLKLCLERATILNRLALIVYCRLYISLATASARVHPARSPRASNRFARAKVAANFACARSSARLTELGVGWRSTSVCRLDTQAQGGHENGCSNSSAHIPAPEMWLSVGDELHRASLLSLGKRVTRSWGPL
jgi:hypothetical protein